MSNRNSSQSEVSQYFSDLTSSDSSWPVAEDDHEALAFPLLPPVNIRDGADPYADLPELETNLAVSENATSFNLGQTSLRQDPLPDDQLRAQLAVSDMQREMQDLRHTIFTLERRLNVYDCILPHLQQESKLNHSRTANVEDYTAKFVTWAFEFKAAVEQVAVQIRQNVDFIQQTSKEIP